MRVDQRQCLGRGAFDRTRDRVDVPLLPGRDAAAQLLRPRRCRPRRGHSGLKLQQAGTRDVGERKIRIGRESALEQLCSTGIRRQQQVDRCHIVADCCGGGRGDRKIEAVRHFHNHDPPALSVAATIALSVTEHGDVAGGTVKSSDRPRNTLASARELRPIRPARHGKDRVPALAPLGTSSLNEKRRSRLGKSSLRNP